MSRSPDMFTPLRQLVAYHDLASKEGSFAISYGSSVRGSETSDLDLLIVTKEPLASVDQDRFIEGLIALHLASHRAIDEEVPYDNKLFYTHKEIREALELPFARPLHPGRIAIRYLDQADDDDAYFESNEMKQRLAFNALTSPHEFLAGDETTYLRVLMFAQQSFAKLVRHLCDGDPRDLDEMLRVSPDGIASKDYLGYTAIDATLLMRVQPGSVPSFIE